MEWNEMRDRIDNILEMGDRTYEVRVFPTKRHSQPFVSVLSGDKVSEEVETLLRSGDFTKVEIVEIQ